MLNEQSKYFVMGIIAAIVAYMLWEYFDEKRMKKNRGNIYVMNGRKEKCNCAGKSNCSCGSHQEMPDYPMVEPAYPQALDFNQLI